MAVTVKIPTQLRAATGGQSEVEVAGTTVGEVLDAVFDAHGDLRERITQDGDLRRFVNVYVSGEDIRFQQGLETSIKDSNRFKDEPGNWAYFSFGHKLPLKKEVAKNATVSCNKCHQDNAKTDFVFSQYYPVLRAATPPAK